DCWAHVQSKDRRKIRGLDPWITALSFQGLDQAGFLAANVSAGAAMDVNLEIIPAAQDVLAQEILCARFGEGSIENLRPIHELAAYIYIGEVHVIRIARDDHALDQLVWVFVNDLLVLESPRLGFIGVANQVNRLPALPIHERPLQSARKTRSASPAQARQL